MIGNFGDYGEDEVRDGGSSLIDQHGCKERRDWHAGAKTLFCCVGTGIQIGGLIGTCDGGENVPCGDYMVYQNEERFHGYLGGKSYRVHPNHDESFCVGRGPGASEIGDVVEEDDVVYVWGF